MNPIEYRKIKSSIRRRRGERKTHQRRKVRRQWYNEPLHRRRKQIAAHLSDELIERWNVRSLPVRKGDTVLIIRGSFKGHEGKVAGVDVRRRKIKVEGATISKTDGTQVAIPIDPSNVIIRKLDLSDRRRREKLEELASS